MREPSLKQAARRERDERIILRAACLLARHPSYFHDSADGRILRLTRIELLQVLASEEER